MSRRKRHATPQKVIRYLKVVTVSKFRLARVICEFDNELCYAHARFYILSIFHSFHRVSSIMRINSQISLVRNRLITFFQHWFKTCTIIIFSSKSITYLENSFSPYLTSYQRFKSVKITTNNTRPSYSSTFKTLWFIVS